MPIWAIQCDYNLLALLLIRNRVAIYFEETFYIAVEEALIDIVEVFINYGPDYYSIRINILVKAIQNNHLPMVSLLLDRYKMDINNQSENKTPLIIAP